MDGRFVAFVVVGSLFLMMSFASYLAVVACSLFCTIVLIGMIQSRFPIIADWNVAAAIIYSFIWALMCVVVMLYTAVLLVPAEHGFAAWMEIGKGLREKNLFVQSALTFVQLFIVLAVTSAGADANKRYHQILKASIILTLVGAVQGIGALAADDFINSMVAAPSSVLDAAAQGVASNFLVPMDLTVILTMPDHELWDVIASKYEIDPYNPFSYTALIGLIVWLWAPIATVFGIRSSGKWLKNMPGKEFEVGSNIPLFLVIFVVLNIIAFTGLSAAAAFASDNYIAKQNVNAFAYLAMLPAPFALIGIYGMLALALASLLDITAGSGS